MCTRAAPSTVQTTMFAMTALGILLPAAVAEAQASFRRGDLNGDGEVTALDYAEFRRVFGSDITTLGVPCEDAWDINDDGSPFINVFDLNTLIAAMDAPETLPAPGGVDCGPDPSPDDLTCVSYPACAAPPLPPSVCEGANQDGSISLPPSENDCGYFGEEELHMVIDGLPVGTELMISVDHGTFEEIVTTPGPGPGEEHEQFNSSLRLVMDGTGSLEDFHKVVVIHDVPTEIDSIKPAGAAPSSSGKQFIQADMRKLSGAITDADGDPDFESLTITAGTENGLESPGGALLKPDGPTRFDVDSAFSVTYQISFVGRDGGPFAGASGTTQGKAIMAQLRSNQLPSSSRWGYLLLIGGIALVAVAAIARRVGSAAART